MLNFKQFWRILFLKKAPGVVVSNGQGTVFKVTPKGKETALHPFCSKDNGTDGATPVGGLIADKQGNLYGTTSLDGKDGRGTIFKLKK